MWADEDFEDMSEAEVPARKLRSMLVNSYFG